MRFSVNDLRRMHLDGPLKGLPLKGIKVEHNFYYVEVDPWTTRLVLREMQSCWEALMYRPTTGLRTRERVLFCATGSVHFPVRSGFSLTVARDYAFGTFNSSPYEPDKEFHPTVPNDAAMDILERAGISDIVGINERAKRTDRKSWTVTYEIDLMFESEDDRTLFTLAM